MYDAAPPASAAVRTALRSLLTSLLLLTPPELTPSQLSDDLVMRHRMLSLPSSTPRAYDLAECSTFSGEAATDYSLSDDERLASQHAFISYLSRPPIELSLTETDIGATARSFFLRRMEVMQIAQQGEVDPIDPGAYELLCCDAWHASGRVLVRFPRNVGERELLQMLVTCSDGTMKLDNLFAVATDAEDVGAELHMWTERCVHGTRYEEEKDDQGAEYINDADDFWAGFSDEEQPNEATAAVAAQQARGGDAHVAAALSTEQESAIKDIVRGAYTLHRSLTNLPENAREEEFLQLVRSAIAHS